LKLDNTVKQIASYKNEEVKSPEVQRLVDVWKEIYKMMLEKYDVSEKFPQMFSQTYHSYMDSKEIIKYLDGIYGEGSISFVGKAMEFNDKAQNF